MSSIMIRDQCTRFTVLYEDKLLSNYWKQQKTIQTQYKHNKSIENTTVTENTGDKKLN